MTKEFREYLQNTKDRFVIAVHELNLSPAQQVPFEDIIIAFDKCRDHLEEQEAETADFYDEWIALWPTSKELSNRGVERIYDHNKFRSKLKSFVEKFYKNTGIKKCPDKKERIVSATKAYIYKIKSGKIEWKHIMTPGNFISHRDKGSSLAMYIQMPQDTHIENRYDSLIG